MRNPRSVVERPTLRGRKRFICTELSPDAPKLRSQQAALASGTARSAPPSNGQLEMMGWEVVDVK